MISSIFPFLKDTHIYIKVTSIFLSIFFLYLIIYIILFIVFKIIITRPLGKIVYKFFIKLSLPFKSIEYIKNRTINFFQIIILLVLLVIGILYYFKYEFKNIYFWIYWEIAFLTWVGFVFGRINKKNL